MLFIGARNTYCQTKTSTHLAQIENLIFKDSISKANNYLVSVIKKHRDLKEYKNSISYIDTHCKIAKIKNPNYNVSKTVSFFDYIPKNTTDKNILFEYNLALSKVYGDENFIEIAVSYLKEAEHIANTINNLKYKAEVGYYLGDYSLKQGDFDLFFEYINNTAKLIEKESHITFEIAPKAFNLKGGIMHFTAKPDSANFYFKKALDYSKKLEQTLDNKYYTPSIIYSNWFLAKQAEGSYTEAQDFIFQAIRLRKSFLEKTKNETLKSKAYANLSLSYRNMTSLMYHTGAYEKSKHFSRLGYNLVRKHVSPKNIRYFHGILLMAETSINFNEYDKALEYLTEAETALKGIEGENYNWYSQLYGVFGNAYYQNHEFVKAIEYYERYDQYWNKNNIDEFQYDDIYLKLNQATTYAQIGKITKAQSLAENIITYVKKQYGESSFLANDCAVTLLKIYNISENYNRTITLAEKITEKYTRNSKNKLIDKYYFETNKANVLLFKAQAEYYLLSHKTETKLRYISKTLEESIELLEERKSLISSLEDINLLLNEYVELIDFTKKIYLELYSLTKKETHLNKIIELHESAIYSRIRARLNLREVKSAEVSEYFLLREKELKKKLNTSFDEEAINEDKVVEIINQIDQWNSFQDSLQKFYPKYHNLRYVAIKNSVDGLNKSIPKNTTLLRYVFIAEQLYVIVLSKDRKQLIPLNYNISKDDISVLHDFKKSISEFAMASNKIYNILWKPIADKVNTQNVIIFPDKELFNISFELLTSVKIDSYEDLKTTSLMSKFFISYNYNLLLIKNNKKTSNYNDNLVAFAPEFNKKMKTDYQLAITDSTELDKSYLNLLPQPFSSDLIKKYTKRLNGNTYLNENASKQVFAKSANEHKIIHIGTHAAANNQNPELSRLVFAKNTSDSTLINDNYLYSYEIYNQSLNSNLAILTACETGKPTYQPGEGMISLAHAFNYAGSESILTSLWQIDEKSSTQILEYFYKYLEDGLRKDQALQKAKLDYLSKARGRTLHPQYWAGLVLMGDTAPIELTHSNHLHWWFLAAIIAITVICFIIFKKRTSSFQNKL
jgi:CHAT domain-containing protein